MFASMKTIYYFRVIQEQAKHRIMKAIGYRYNSKERSHRRFNCCGREKNPNKVRFFARTLEAAEPYRTIYDEDGFELYECELQVEEVEGNFFDMEANFRSLETYKQYINAEVGMQLRDYTEFRNNAKIAKEKKHWDKMIAELDNREKELISALQHTNFQALSDFQRQNTLIAELTAAGFDGYITRDEIAIF
jgi:hypothetical protein